MELKEKIKREFLEYNIKEEILSNYFLNNVVWFVEEIYPAIKNKYDKNDLIFLVTTNFINKSNADLTLISNSISYMKEQINLNNLSLSENFIDFKETIIETLDFANDINLPYIELYVDYCIGEFLKYKFKWVT